MHLHYRKYGDGEPLIILHGLFGSSDNWHSLARRWGTHFQVFTLDLRNHGISPHESEMTYDEMVTDFHQFIQQQGLKSINLLGHSMGGKVAMLYACQHPENVNAIAILDIGIEKTGIRHAQILMTLRQLEPSEYATRSDIQVALKNLIDSPAIQQLILKNILRRVDGSFAWKFNTQALIDHYSDLTSALELPDVFMGPCLFLRGENSDYIDQELSADILRFLPLAQLESIPKAGHWLHADQPDLVFSRIVDFFL